MACAVIGAFGRTCGFGRFKTALSVYRFNQSKTNRTWELRLSETELFTPQKIVFISNEMDGEIQAVLAGKAVSQLSTLSCAEYLKTGQLRVVLPDLLLEKWQFYLYRPYQTLTPKRVIVVFECLERILKQGYGEM